MKSLQWRTIHSIVVFFNLLLSLKGYEAATQKEKKTSVHFINFGQSPVELFWEDSDPKNLRNGEKNKVNVGSLPPYGSARHNSFIGHTFEFGDDLGKVTIEKEDQIFIVGLIGVEEVLVECSTTGGTFHAHIKPYWSPFGAARFLELVHMGYFEGCGLNRVVPQFLTQFGISADYEMRKGWRMKNLPDDTPAGVDFKPGYMSYAGSGPNSRSTEVFIVMPGVSDRQLKYFGTNSWETPFGYVEMDDVNNVVGKWYSYGDMPPWGHGPESQKIYHMDGYEYLETYFPKLSYIKTCRIVNSFSKEEEEEL